MSHDRWVIGPRGVEEDRPVKLTEEQIETLLKERVARVYGADKEATDLALEQIRNWYRLALKEVRLCPSGLKEYGETLERMHTRAIIGPGTPVGLDMAGGLGQVVSQNALSSFHTSGAAKRIATDIATLKELLFGARNRKNKTCSVYFNSRLSFDDAIDKKFTFVGVYVGDLVIRKPELGPIVDILEGGVPGRLGESIEDEKKDELGEGSGLERYWWHDINMRSDVPLPNSNYCLRLHLDVALMYSHRITMDQVVEAIERRGERMILCLHSPMDEGIVDIFADEDMVEKKNTQDISLPLKLVTCLQDLLMNCLNSLKVKGIAGITNIYPVSVPVWAAIAAEELLEPEEDMLNAILGLEGDPERDSTDWKGNLWDLALNENVMTSQSITLTHIREVLAAAGIIVLFAPGFGFEETEMSIVVKMPVDWQWINAPTSDRPEQREAKKLKKPRDFINALIQKERDDERNEIIAARSLALKKGEDYFPEERPQGPLIRASEIYYIDTEGSDLMEIFVQEDVDTTHTISNDFWEIAAVLGVEAARACFVEQLSNLVRATESYINFHSIEMCADFVFCRGRMLGITYTGMMGRNVGPLSGSSFEGPMKIIRNAAISGASESMKNVSAAITVGQLPGLGTGIVSLVADKEKEKRYLAEINARASKALQMQGGATDFAELAKAISQGNPLALPTEESDGKFLFSDSIEAMENFVTGRIEHVSDPTRQPTMTGVTGEPIPIVPVDPRIGGPRAASINFIPPDEDTIRKARMEIPISEHLKKRGIELSTIVVTRPTLTHLESKDLTGEIAVVEERKVVVTTLELLTLEEAGPFVTPIIGGGIPPDLLRDMKTIDINDVEDRKVIIGKFAFRAARGVPRATRAGMEELLASVVLAPIPSEKNPKAKMTDISAFLSFMGGNEVGEAEEGD